MTFRSYDSLRTFDVVARSLSMTVAASQLNHSKGSISYQINKLETELGFNLFERSGTGLSLTEAGRRLWHVSQSALQQIDREIVALQGRTNDAVTVGVLTYIASRWLSPRLTQFFSDHPGISLRIEPVQHVAMLESLDVDLGIIWEVGKPELGERLLSLPAVPVASRGLADKVSMLGLEQAVKTLPLLGDSSGDAGWKAWHQAAGLLYQPSVSSLTIPDSNSRVQAVIDGQGLGLWDDLVAPEITAGQLVKVSNVALDDAGYTMVLPRAAQHAAADAFIDWIRVEAQDSC